jgi:hypothetical protein
MRAPLCTTRTPLVSSRHGLALFKNNRTYRLVQFCGVPQDPADPPQAGVAQLVEQLIRNQQVISSSLIAGSRQTQDNQ